MKQTQYNPLCYSSCWPLHWLLYRGLLIAFALFGFITFISCTSSNKVPSTEFSPLLTDSLEENIENYIKENQIVGLLLLNKYKREALIDMESFYTYETRLLESIKKKTRQYFLAKNYKDTLIYSDAYDVYNVFRNTSPLSQKETAQKKTPILKKEEVISKYITQLYEEHNYPLAGKQSLFLYKNYPDYFHSEHILEIVENNLNAFQDETLISVFCEDNIFSDDIKTTVCDTKNNTYVETIADMLDSTFVLDIDKGFMRYGPAHEIGSAFFISTDGYALTNHHVVQSVVTKKGKVSAEITAKLKTTDYKSQAVEVIAYDELIDIALVKVTDKKVEKIFPIANNTDIKEGDKITVIGAPLGLANTVTSGIISSQSRTELVEVGGVLQLDASVNHGNSGGPLVDEIQKNVVGIIVAKIDGVENINFAIPSKVVQAVLPHLFEGDKVIHSWLGLGGYMVEEGFEILYIAPNTPAAFADIEIGDIVTHINEQYIEDFTETQIDFLSKYNNELMILDIIKNNSDTKETEEKKIFMVTSERKKDILWSNVDKKSFYKLFPILMGTQIEVISNGFIPKYRISKVYDDSLSSYMGFTPGDTFAIRRIIAHNDSEGIRQGITLELKILQQSRGFLEDIVAINLFLSTKHFL